MSEPDNQIQAAAAEPPPKDQERVIQVKPKIAQPTSRGDWLAKLQEWAFQLTVLKVVTYVGDAEIQLDRDKGTLESITVAPGGAALVTSCDLIGGDITNVIPPALKDEAGLRDFHAKQVTSAAAVLPNNLRVLADLWDSVLGR